MSDIEQQPDINAAQSATETKPIAEASEKQPEQQPKPTAAAKAEPAEPKRTPAVERLHREVAEMKDDLSGCCSAQPLSDDNLFEWGASLYIPPESLPPTPWDNGLFSLHVRFPAEYPFKPPKVVFLTRVFHPNISPDGRVCLDLLTEKGWNPAFTLSKVLLSVLCLLHSPNVGDDDGRPLVIEAADLYLNDRAKFDEKVRYFVKRYAID